MADEIFISYSRQDERFARQLALWLNKTLKTGIWIDIEDINPGIKWSAAIQEGLDSTELMIVIITPESMASVNVEDEWQYFLDQDKPIIPILLKSAPIPYQLRRVQYIDFSIKEEYNESLRQLVSEIRKHIRPTEAETLAARDAARTNAARRIAQSKADQRQVEERERSARRNRRLIVVLGLLVAALVGAVAVLALLLLNQEDALDLNLLSGDPAQVRIYSSADDTVGRAYSPGDSVQAGEIVDTGDAVVEISGEDGEAFVAQTGTLFRIGAFTAGQLVVGVDRGQASISGNPDSQIQTPGGIDVTGTDINVDVDDTSDQTTAACPEGCTVTSGDGTNRQLNPDEEITVAGSDLANAEIRGIRGPVVFQTLRHGGAWELYTMNADGSNQRRLTDNTYPDEDPVWSPDGTRIAFKSQRGTQTDIYIIDLSDPDDPQERDLTGDLDTGIDESPAWSPDGERIAFTSGDGFNSDVYIVDITGENLEQVTDSGFASGPDWSPDGTQIAYSDQSDGHADIFTLDLTDPDAAPINRTDSTLFDIDPAWSPDGTRIAFGGGPVLDHEIFVLDIATGDVRLVSRSQDIEGEPTWSPDGTRIIFISTREGNRDLFIINADGTGEAVNLTQMRDSDDESPHWLPIRTAGD